MIKVLDLNFLNISEAIASFLIETSEGPILIETGPHSVLPHLDSAVQKTGYNLSDIKHVFLTHIHLDHAGAAWTFAEQGAKIYLHPFGIKHMADPSRLMESARRIYKDDMDRLWGEMNPIPENQMHATAHNEKIRIGDTTIKSLHSPGHAVHHIAWQIGDVVFAGDVAGVKILNGPVVPPCPPPDINVEDWKASIELLKNADFKKLYLTHFGEVTDINNHLEALANKLDDWANWMKPYFEKGEDLKAITPVFQAYVTKQLMNEGVAKQDLTKYEAANPSWMSVAGLMRYWKKRLDTK